MHRLTCHSASFMQQASCMQCTGAPAYSRIVAVQPYSEYLSDSGWITSSLSQASTYVVHVIVTSVRLQLPVMLARISHVSLYVCTLCGWYNYLVQLVCRVDVWRSTVKDTCIT